MHGFYAICYYSENELEHLNPFMLTSIWLMECRTQSAMTDIRGIPLYIAVALFIEVQRNNERTKISQLVFSILKLPPKLFYEVGSLFSNHDGRSVGVAADQRWHY